MLGHFHQHRGLNWPKSSLIWGTYIQRTVIQLRGHFLSHYHNISEKKSHGPCLRALAKPCGCVLGLWIRTEFWKIDIWLLFGDFFRASSIVCNARDICLQLSFLFPFLRPYLLWRQLLVWLCAGGWSQIGASLWDSEESSHCSPRSAPEDNREGHAK